MSNQNGRALQLLEKLKLATGLSETGKRALIQLINPFTDFEFERTGYFDTNEAASVIQCVKLSKVISAPASAAGGNWDCHIFSTPYLNRTPNIINARLFGGDLMLSGVEGTSLGGVTCATGPAGANLSVCGFSGSVADMDATGLCPDFDQLVASPSFVSGTCRLIGMGFEVHNTTAPLYQQGSVAVYRQPNPLLLDRQTVNVVGLGTGTITAPTTLRFEGSSSIQQMNDVPAGISEVLLLAGTRQWEAKLGCMCVPTLNNSDIPVQRLANVTPVVRRDLVNIDLTGVGGQPSVVASNCSAAAFSAFVNATVAPPTGGVVLRRTPFVHCTNFNTAGAYFSGLSTQTTLLVNTIFYIERFPTEIDTDLVVIANPSPPHDPVAKALYSEIMRTAPPGVKVGDNADGDWFFQAVKSVSDFLSPALTATGHPLGMALGGAGALASKWAEEKLKERNKNNGQVVKALPAPRPSGVGQGSTWNGKGRAVGWEQAGWKGGATGPKVTMPARPTKKKPKGKK